MTTNPTKVRSVLDLVADGLRAVSGDWDGGPVDDHVWFEQPHEHGESLRRVCRVVLDRETFNDLGQPRQITLAITPREKEPS